jgi:tRNA pseudouridine32 synthase / 23S rRNA pseudouridine746 synthase
MQIIYDDSQILTVNKPAGVLSIADGYDRDLPHVRTLLEPEFGRLWVVHRLDKETSGVMILARTPEAHRALNLQFTIHSIRKEYRALVFGDFPETLIAASPLLVDGDRHHRTIVDEARGKPASTRFSLSKSFNAGISLISAFPSTGFTHQIRAHLYHAGFPILGDQLYCTPESKLRSEQLEIYRVALHAELITFVHPETNISLTLTADPPEDFQKMCLRCN